MRHFHSYGPVDCTRHYCVPREELVERCLNQLIDDPQQVDITLPSGRRAKPGKPG